MDRDTAREIITPLRSKIVTAALTGYDDVMHRLDPGFVSSLKPRTRAGNIWDRIRFQMILAFGMSGSVRWVNADDNPQLEFLLIEGNPEGVALRHKKAHRFNPLTSNYPTDYQRRVRQEQYVMYGDVPPAHLFMVVTEDENEIEPQVERILITSEYCSNGKNQIEWWYELYRAEGSGAIPFGTGFEQPVLPGSNYLGKIKPAKQRQETPGRVEPTGTNASPDQPETDKGTGTHGRETEKV
jgi:hypothetical protein